MSESFESLKSEIIAHLKKLEQEENTNELKKAVAYFTNSESLVTCLEKLENGTWIEKAGYGVGTVRIWKGKKYKKISTSPVKWVRVFDKMDRGAKNALTRLVHQAEKIDNSEEMLKFVLANKQRFVDDNGKPLDFIDRLNAVIDGKTYSDKSPKATVTDSQTNERVIADKKDKELNISDSEINSLTDIDYLKDLQKKVVKENNRLHSEKKYDEANDMARRNYVISDRIKQLESESEKNNKKSDYVKEIVDKTDRYTSKDYENLKAQVLDGKTGLIGGGDDIPKEERAAILQSLVDSMKKDEEAKNKKDVKNKADDKLIKLEEKLSKLKSKDIELTLKNNGRWGDGMRLSKLPSNSSWEKNREKIKEVENEIKKIKADNEKKQNERKDIYWIQDSKGNRITNLDAKEILINNLNRLGNITNNLSNKLTKDEEMKLLGEKFDLLKENQFLTERLNSNDRKEMESEQEKHKNRSDAMKGNDNAKKDNAKPTITFDRNGRLGEKAVNTKLGTDNIKALDALPEKFDDDKRIVLKYPSEVEIDGEKKLAYTNGRFLVVTHDIPANGVKTKQSEKIQGDYPNVEKVIPKEFKDNSAPKVDIDIDQVMKDLPKVDFSKKAFNDDSHKQFMKIGNFWYDAKMVKATYDMLKGDNAEVLESKDTYSDGRFGRLCIKTDKGYSVIVSLSNDYAENYKKQSIYNSDEGSMSASAKAEYESRKKTGLPDTYINNAVEFGYQIDNKGFIHGEDKNITFKGKGDNTEFYYNGIPTGIKNRSSYMYGTKENIQTRIDAVKKQIEYNIESYKEGKKNPANKPSNYDTTFPNMTDKDLTDIYKWWSNPKNIEEAIYKNSYKTKVPGLGSYGNDARKIGVVEDRVMDMLPDIKKEIARRGITIRKSLDGELIFESSLESYVKKSISIMKKSLIG